MRVRFGNSAGRSRRLNLRRFAVVGVVLVLLGALAVFIVREGSPRAPSLEEMADDVGRDIMRNLQRGHVPRRSGEVMLVPKPHRYLTGRWDLRTLGSGEPETFVSHPNPWAYLAHVPLIFYGPGVAPGEQVGTSVDLTDVAATYADIVGLEGFRGDGRPLDDVVSSTPQPPRVIVTVVLDGGGWNVLRRYPSAWPNIRRLMSRGTTYTNATIGSAPSLTGAIHANLGTGYYPATHGVPTNPWFSVEDPSDLRVPTVSELWDERSGNDAVVAMMGYLDPHVGMIGRGAQREGGDRDIAVLWNQEQVAWETNERYYEMPRYLQPTDREALDSYERRLDLSDGASDGRWRGDDFDSIREASPAFATLTGDAVVAMIENERFAADEVTDFLWIQMKMPDSAGHLWNMVAPQSQQVLGEVDRQVGRFQAAIEERVGEGGYLFAVTADHGQEALAETTGGWRINLKELQDDIEGELGPVVELVTTLDLQLDLEEMRSRGVEMQELVDLVSTYTLGDNIPDGAPGSDLVAEERLDERLFAGVFPSEFLQGLSPAEIQSFGESSYREGDLTSLSDNARTE